MNGLKKLFREHRAYMVFTLVQLVLFVGLLVLSIHPAGKAELDFSADYITSGSVELPYGAYEVEIGYEITGWDNYVGLDFVMSAENAPSYFYASARHLDTDESSVTTLCWLNNVLGKEHINFGLQTYSGSEEARILSVTFTEKISYRILMVAGFLLLMLVLNGGVYYFLIKENAPHRNTVIGICVIIFFSSILVFSKYIYDCKHDLGFHLNRIVAIAQGIREGDWRIYIQPHMMNGYGYATPIFYPQLFLYIPALLYSMYVPLYVSYFIYIFVMNTATCLIAWYSFGRIAKNRRITFIACLIYCLSMYRLTNIYVRAAVGEYTAMTFLPLVLYGLYRIYEKDSEKLEFADVLPLVFGVTGIVRSHVISIEMSAEFIVLFALIMCKKTFKKRRFLMLLLAVGIAVLLNAGVLYVLYSGTRMDVAISGGFALDNIQSEALVPAQLFTIFGNAEGISNNGGTYYDIPVAPGIGIIIGCGAMLWIAINRKKYIDDHNIRSYRRGIIGLCFTLAALFLSTQLFPWDAISVNPIMQKLEKLVSIIQFPWRYLMIAVICGSFTTIEALNIICGTLGEKSMNRIGLIIAIFTMVSAGYFYGNYIYTLNNTVFYSEYDCNDRYIGTLEYLPNHADEYTADNRGLLYDSGSVEVYDYAYEGKGVTGFNVVNASSESNITLPIYYYDGYIAYDSTTKESFAVSYDSRKTVTVTVPEGYSGRINVRYKAPASWRVAEVISFVSLLGTVAAYIMIYRKKKVSD